MVDEVSSWPGRSPGPDEAASWAIASAEADRIADHVWLVLWPGGRALADGYLRTHLVMVDDRGTRSTAERFGVHRAPDLGEGDAS